MAFWAAIPAIAKMATDLEGKAGSNLSSAHMQFNPAAYDDVLSRRLAESAAASDPGGGVSVSAGGTDLLSRSGLLQGAGEYQKAQSVAPLAGIVGTGLLGAVGLPPLSAVYSIGGAGGAGGIPSPGKKKQGGTVTGLGGSQFQGADSGGLFQSGFRLPSGPTLGSGSAGFSTGASLPIGGG